ncbi:hypothetical protein JW859_05865 [bacterium]|nr:hypothetical protein [bacterium]
MIKLTNVCVFLLVLLAATTASAQDEPAPFTPRPLVDVDIYQVDAAVPVYGDTVVAAARLAEEERYTFLTLDTSGAPPVEWVPDWDPSEYGWEPADGPVLFLKASPDGQWLCYDQWVHLPDEFATEFEYMHQAELVMLSRPDGSEARPIAVTIQVGGGAEFDFTADGSRIVGQPLIKCLPTPGSYARFLELDGADPDVPPFNYYDVTTGERGYLESLNIGDGYWKCPYSDNFRLENNWYAEHRFGNFMSGEILGEWIEPEGRDAFLSNWVLPDAMLMSNPGRTGLLYVDGRFMPAPQDCWHCYCWLPDGTFLFSLDDGFTVRYGKVDWSSFTIDWATDASPLADYLYYNWTPLADSSGILLTTWDRGGELLWTPVSKAGAKP